ncbi:MAG: hypothetical protein WC752_03025 [Patescibacteria group bacterium]|jgi:hypothetical protein
MSNLEGAPQTMAQVVEGEIKLWKTGEDEDEKLVDYLNNFHANIPCRDGYIINETMFGVPAAEEVKKERESRSGFYQALNDALEQSGAKEEILNFVEELREKKRSISLGDVPRIRALLLPVYVKMRERGFSHQEITI